MTANYALIDYLQQQIRTSEERLKRFTCNPLGEELPRRFAFAKLQKYIQDFLSKKLNNRMMILPGFRGVGKTTLMAQICTLFSDKVENYLFISVEDSKNLLNAGISDLILAYEEILGYNLESAKKPILIFLDEIQSDEKWAITLKSLFEKTTNVFFCCSGSSAITLQTTPNLARRAIFEKITPMCFMEFEMIKNEIPPSKLKNKINKVIYFSKKPKEIYEELLELKPEINKYWSKVNKMDIKKYLSYGSLPFALTLPNETSVYDSISMLLDKIIKIDLPTINEFNNETLGAVKRILFAIAENDTTSLNKLEERFNINRLTIANIFDALEKSELLIKIPAYGANMTIAKKPHKYLFMSSAVRMSFFYFTGQNSTYLTRQGKLLEDSIGGHLYREFTIKGQGAIRYDSSEGGADFILQILNEKQIIIEAGMGKKDARQIVNSSKRINSDYNLVFCASELELKKEINTVFVPLDYYFLM
jgi:predicted AAA+ superfamily ATPase